MKVILQTVAVILTIQIINAIPTGCPHPWVEGEEVYFQHPDCTKFYQCVHGKPQVMPCAPGTEWNDARKECDWPNKAGCSSYPGTTAPTTKVPTTASPTTARPTTARPTTSRPTTSKPNACPKTGCPEVWTPGEEVYLPHPDCDKFCQCVHGKPIEMPCAPGTEWNDAKKECDWPQKAGCSSNPGTTAQTTKTPTTAAPTTKTPTTAAPTTKAPTTAAPTTKAPTTAAPTTAAPTTARPTTSRPTTARPTTSRPTTSKPNACPKTGCPEVWTPGEEVYLPHPDCDKFCQCVHGKPVEMPCAPGTEWNDAKKECDWPQKAGCSSNPGTTAQTTKAPTTATPTTKAPTTAAPTTKAPTTAAPTTAAPTTARPTTSRPTTARPTTSRPTTSKPNACPKTGCPEVWTPGEEVYLPHPDCDKFCQCVHGKPVEMPCAPGTEWNDAKKECDWPQKAGCSSNPGTTAQTTKAPTTAAPTTKAPTTAAPTTKAPTTAAPTTARPTTSRPTTARPTTSRPTTSKPNACPKTGCPEVWTPGEEVYLPHPDCDKFCQCVHGKPVEMPCAPGTEWNDAKKECDWPQKAGCSSNPGTTAQTTKVPTTAAPTTARPPTSRPTTARPTTARPTTSRPTTSKPNACPKTGCPEVWTPGQEVYLKHPNCKMFCQCVHGKPVEMPCAPGTEWNDAKKECDWPREAKCSS